jgi:hypothetical protein
MEDITMPRPPAFGHKLIDANLNPVKAVEARWIRPPIQGKGPCQFTGLGHASFYGHFIGNRRIRQARMGTGKQRGTRLLWLPDIYAEIQRLADEQGTGEGMQ